LSIQNDAIPGLADFLPPAWLRSTKLPHRNIEPGVDYLEPFSSFSGYHVGTMNKISSRRARRASHLLSLGLGLASFALLTGCISSDGPILTDGQPLLGKEPRLRFYVLRDGTAREPSAETFRWQDGRYVPIGGNAKDIGPFTLHAFEGPDLIVQSLRAGKPVEYGIARKLADGVYLLAAVDESDADAATQNKFCEKPPGTACRVTSREAVLAFARASAAKPHAGGGLALLMEP
jgi:hypothetical protein